MRGKFVTWVNNAGEVNHGVAYYDDQTKIFVEQKKLLIQLTDENMVHKLNVLKKPIYKITDITNVTTIGYTD